MNSRTNNQDPLTNEQQEASIYQKMLNDARAQVRSDIMREKAIEEARKEIRAEAEAVAKVAKAEAQAEAKAQRLSEQQRARDKADLAYAKKREEFILLKVKRPLS